MRSVTAIRLGTIAAFMALAGCALKDPPDATQLRADSLPNARIPPAWVSPGAGPGPVQDQWLLAFGDPRLQQLVAEAIAYNTDLRVAAARVEQAEAYVRIAGGEVYPAVNALAHGGGKLGGDQSGTQGWLISASWELDLWGRVRYGARAAQDQYASAQADYAYARASIAALVAKAWFLATEATLQRDLAAAVVRSSEDTAGLTRQRSQVGVGTDLDLALAQANLETSRDSLRALTLAREQALRALELLLGRYPAAEIEVPPQFSPVPEPTPAAGLPSELLERRPDVIAAERRVATAFDRVGEAQAARLPRISLTAGASHITSELFVLQARDYVVFGLGGNLFAPLFQGGALQAQVDLRAAEQKQAIDSYALVGLRAFGEVESALASEATLREREQLLTRSVRENTQALELEQIRYRIGSRDLRSVLQQQTTLAAARTQLVRVQSEQRVQRVNLLLALGGRFDAAPQ
jgi:NodT family efflux transporter outer membrane factor (OMF) lipoprotein